MKPSQLIPALETCIDVQQPAFIWGPPGVGKSDIVRNIADRKYASQYGYQIDSTGRLRDPNGKFTSTRPWLRDVRALLLDPVDLRGLPCVNGDNRAHFAQPDFLPREGSGLLFLDELNAAPPLTQAACYQLVLDRALGEYTLPDGWVIVAAGNRESDGAVTHRMPTALKTRMAHLNAEVDVIDWCKWAVDSDIEPIVIAFIRFRPELLHAFDARAQTFPTPRTWAFVSRIVRAAMQDKSVEFELIKGIVGEAAAIEFCAFARLYRTLPAVDQIIMDPLNAPVPAAGRDQAAQQYAIAAALARLATDASFGSIMKYMDRLPQEFAVMSIRDATRRDATLTSLPVYTKWMAKHSDVIL